ncbi:hypothetical protein [Streptomyces sp. NPDC021020]|uniref:hypothetical protein n=1 Tax=Streptomyces sp. NPDC021020 TaxID=3365109 RepID=UPI0037A8B3E8
MELYVIDSKGSMCAAVGHGEPSQRVLFKALDDVGLARPGSEPEPDVEITGEQLPRVVDGVREALRDLLAATPVGDAKGMYDASAVEILGERVWIRVRDQSQYALKRLNSLYLGLEGAAKSQTHVTVLAVPVLDALDKATLAVAHHGVERSRLAAALRERYAHLQSLTSDPQMTADLARHADAVFDDELLDRHLARLAAWKLVRLEADGSVLPTRKLQLVRPLTA